MIRKWKITRLLSSVQQSCILSKIAVLYRQLNRPIFISRNCLWDQLSLFLWLDIMTDRPHNANIYIHPPVIRPFSVKYNFHSTLVLSVFGRTNTKATCVAPAGCTYGKMMKVTSGQYLRWKQFSIKIKLSFLKKKQTCDFVKLQIMG